MVLHITFDFNTNPIDTLKLFRNNPAIYFNSKQNKYLANGSGANTQVYDYIGAELFRSNLFTITGYFVDINPVEFWTHYVEAFSNFLRMYINVGCKMPYHFVPSLLEVLTGKRLTMADMIWYTDKIDPDVAKMLQRSDYDIADTGFRSKAEAYRHICRSGQAQPIYFALKQHLSFEKFRIRKLDCKLSGPYVIKPEMVLKILRIYPRKYTKMFHDFVGSMSDTEIRSMLMTFGNTVSLNTSYHINVDEYPVDINVSVCGNYIRLSDKLFSDNHLQNLKIHFAQADSKICDRVEHVEYDKMLLAIVLSIVLIWYIFATKTIS